MNIDPNTRLSLFTSEPMFTDSNLVTGSRKWRNGLRISWSDLRWSRLLTKTPLKSGWICWKKYSVDPEDFLEDLFYCWPFLFARICIWFDAGVFWGFLTTKKYFYWCSQASDRQETTTDFGFFFDFVIETWGHFDLWDALIWTIFPILQPEKWKNFS